MRNIDKKNKKHCVEMEFGVILKNERDFFTIEIHGTESINVQKSEIVCNFTPYEGDFLCINYDEEKKIESIQPHEWDELYTDEISDICDGFIIVGQETVIFDNDGSLKVGDTVVCDRVKGEFETDNHGTFHYRGISFKRNECDREENDISQSMPSLVNASKNPETFIKIREASDACELNSSKNGSRLINLLKTRGDYNFEIPCELEEIFKENSNVIHDHLDKIIPCELEFSTYEQRFHNLVYLEELNMLNSFKKYVQTEAYFKVKKDSTLFTLDFEGLHELRPSILKGDTVFATQIDPPNRTFIGLIKETESAHMIIKFDISFMDEFDPMTAFIVRFQFSRCVFIRMHKGIQRAAKRLGEDFLFPSEIGTAHSIELNFKLDGGMLKMDDREIPWYNKELDDTQKCAVVQALQANFRPLPNIIYGPPGTGKTSTLIEIILHVFTQSKDCRILIAAHSNSATNLILARLSEYEFLQENLLRLMSQTYMDKHTIPLELHRYCCTVDTNRDPEKEIGESSTGIKTGCNLDYVKKFRIVVGTCVGLGTLMYDRTDSINFTKVFIDEAGQCSEPEVMVPVSLLDSKNGSVILAGDPMQMPPLVLCSYANKRGLAVSLLERLVERYTTIETESEKKKTKSHYKVHLISKLLYNYRSVPSILHYYNKHFYGSSLKATVTSESREMQILANVHLHKLIPFNRQRDLNHAIYFCDVLGRDRQIVDNTSWCNPQESTEIVNFIPKLLNLGLNGDDIGVITPYHLQVCLIKEQFKTNNIETLVGSVDEFQGLERQVILISTVRTRKGEVEKDIRRKLGIVACPKRTNVAISRARALVVVFGRAELLERDKYWKDLIDECKQKGTFY